MLFLSAGNKLLAVADGEAIPLSDVPVKVFSSKTPGDGFAVEPIRGTIYSPISGRVEYVADTKDAFSIRAEDGLDIMVQIGLGTANSGGKGIICLVDAGDNVRAGDLIAKADIAAIKADGCRAIASVLVSGRTRLKSCDLRLGRVRGGKSAVMSYKK